MPELPEVEYTARQLRGSIVGASIAEVEVFWERVVGYPIVEDFRAQIVGRTIEGVRRRGKFLLIDLSGGLLMTVHRRMTGNFLLLPAGWQVDESLRERDRAKWDVQGPMFMRAGVEGDEYGAKLRYCRVAWLFGDGRRLLFTDPRKFGRIELWPREQEQEALSGLGPEPLDEQFDVEGFAQALAARKTGIKQVLLDQGVVAGIGNIYADEALYYAGIHPLRKANSLTRDEVRKLQEGIVAVLMLGIEHGGTSFNDYRDLWGEAGDNYGHVRVYHQEGKPCTRCGTTIERLVIAQRSAHFCPTCQPLEPAGEGVGVSRE
jgi:formamidopyrimidine-DNA glycosylase